MFSGPNRARWPFHDMSNGCATKHASVFLSVSSLPPSTTLSHTVASQSLLMSSGGVANDNSVTLTLADAQGMLDGVTLNLNTQVTSSKGLLGDFDPEATHYLVSPCMFRSSGSNLSCHARRPWALSTGEPGPAGHTGQSPLSPTPEHLILDCRGGQWFPLTLGSLRV